MERQDEGLEQMLDRCLDIVIKDDVTLESCLQLYPRHAAELEPLLRIALETRRSLYFTPSAAAKDRARLALHNAIRQPKATPQWRRPWSLLGSMSPQLSGPYRWAVGAAVSLLLVVMAGTGVVAASSGSMPGETLYPVKRAVELVRLNTAFNQQAKAQLYVTFATRRSQELAVMAAKGDTKRAERLATEVEQHLRRVQENALPGLTVIPLPPGTDPNGPREELIQEMKQLNLGVTGKRNMEALREHLESALQRQDTAFQQARQEASEPARNDLDKAQNATRQNYEALLEAVQWLAEDGSAPAEK